MTVRRRRSIFFGAALLAAAAIVGQAGDPRIERARADLRRGWVLRAIATYERVLEAYPGDASVWKELGAAEERQGRFDRAVRAYEQVLHLQPGDLEALSRLGLILSWKKSTWPRAIECLEAALRLDARDTANRRLLADLFSWSGQHRPAAAEYRKLIDGDPHNPELLLALARSLVWLQQGGEALPLFGEATAAGARLDQTSRHAHALALFQAGRYQEAEHEFVALAREYPLRADYRQTLADVRAELRDLPRRQAEAAMQRGRDLYAAGETPEAFAAFEAALANHEDPDWRLEYADLLAAAGRSHEALRQLDRAGRSDRADRVRARIYAADPGSRELAFALYLRLYRANPTDAALGAELAALLAWMPLQPLQALVAEQLLAEGVGGAELHLSLARCYERGRDHERAAGHAAAAGPGAEAARIQVSALRALGRIGEAEAALAVALESHPDDASLNELSGWMLLDDDPEGALAAFRRANTASARVGEAEALLAMRQPYAARAALVTAGGSAGAASVHARVDQEVDALIGVAGLVGWVDVAHRSGEEAARATNQGELSTPALKVVRTPGAAVLRLSERASLEVGGGLVAFDGGSVGAVDGAAGGLKLRWALADAAVLSLGAGATVAGEVTALARIEGRTPRLEWSLQFERSSLDESLLTAAGVRDRSNGAIVGPVMATGGAAGVLVRFGDCDAGVRGRVDRLAGSGLDPNWRFEAVGSVGRELADRSGPLRGLDYLHVSGQFLVLAFAHDASAVPVTLADGETWQVRGYFSPSSYLGPAGRVDFGVRHGGLAFSGGAGLGVYVARGVETRFFEDATSVGFDVEARLTYPLSERTTLRLEYANTNSGETFREQRVVGGVSVRW